MVKCWIVYVQKLSEQWYYRFTDAEGGYGALSRTCGRQGPIVGSGRRRTRHRLALRRLAGPFAAFVARSAGGADQQETALTVVRDRVAERVGRRRQHQAVHDVAGETATKVCMVLKH